MARLNIVRALPRYHALVSPAPGGRRRAVVIDERNESEVEADSIAIIPSTVQAAGWADVQLRGSRLRIPVKYSQIPRKGGVLLGVA